MTEAAAPAKSSRCRMVLIVEDDPDIRESLAMVLDEAGYPCEQASNGQEAIEKLATLPRPCLILLDLMMPVMNGWEFIRKSGEDAILAQIPIALVTAYAERAQGLPVQTVIKKPVDIDLLLRLIETYCGSAPSPSKNNSG